MMSKHAVADVTSWGYRGSGMRYRVHPTGLWWHKARHGLNQHRETVGELLQSIRERDEREALRKRKLLAEQKREAERLACENRTDTMHLSASGEYYCWHANLAFGPDMPADQPFTLTIPVPKDLTNIPALLPCQHQNTMERYITEDYYPGGQYGPVSRWPICTDIVDIETVCSDCGERRP